MFKKPSCPYPTYDSLRGAIRYTERDWNSKVPIIKVLRHLTLALNADINIIQFMRVPAKEKKFHQCNHQATCHLLKYQFQSSLVKLLFEADFYPITLLHYKNTYYILNKLTRLAPFLINVPRQETIQFMEYIVTQQDIFNIMKNTPLTEPKPFSIGLYTSFTYIGSYPHHHPAHTNLLGWYQGHNNKTCHIFVTPLIMLNKFTLSYLDSSNTHKNMCCLKNTYSSPHITEGQPRSMPNLKDSETHLLNQDFCVCQHPTTKNFIVPGNHTFKNLGKAHPSLNRTFFGII